MEKAPVVSIIVPNYNHAVFLAQRLDSIFKQTFTDYELILLDDCSSDGSREILETFRTHANVSHVVLNETNSGSTFLQWKKGIALAKGKYVWIAESDDFCDPDFLETAINKLEAGAGLFSAKTLNVDENGTIISHHNSWMDDISATRWDADYENGGTEEIAFALVVKNTIPNASGVVFRLHEQVLPLLDASVGMRYCGDWLFWMHYLAGDTRMYYSAQTRNYFRSHAAVTRYSHSKELRNKEISKILRYALSQTKDTDRKKYLVRYYFREHYYVFPKRAIGKNLPLFFRQMAVSVRFFSCWWNYYFN